MSNVIKFTGETLLDLNPDDILEEAKGKLEKVMIIGYTEEGDEYFSSSFADGMTAVWLLERFKNFLVNIVDDEDDD
jgi:hypothetical protein